MRDVIGFATINGARANRLDSKIGTLTPGKDADVIVVGPRHGWGGPAEAGPYDFGAKFSATPLMQ